MGETACIVVALVQEHYCDVIMGRVASQITSLTIVYTIVYSDADHSKHQNSVSLVFVLRIHRGPVNSPHKWPVTRKMLPFDDVIMNPSDRRYVLSPVNLAYARSIFQKRFNANFTWKQCWFVSLIFSTGWWDWVPGYTIHRYKTNHHYFIRDPL